MMSFRIVDSGWGKELTDAVRVDGDELRIVSPFIKAGALKRLLSLEPKNIQVITRFNLEDFSKGVSDIEALRQLLKAGARVRGVRGLHSKLYLFGTSRAIITSANLTKSALDSNHEFGVVVDDSDVISTCQGYFNDMWEHGNEDLQEHQLDEWQEKVSRYLATGARPGRPSGLGDYGADAGLKLPETTLPTVVGDAHQAFVKFLGTGGNRVQLSYSTIKLLEESGCHWAVAYPKSKRPRSVEDGAVMFISRLTSDPNDIRIFGRAIAMKHAPGRDDATDKDIELREWKSTWPRYIRVHCAEFVAGSMENGVSLNELMDTLEADSFAPTQRNARNKEGNTNPRHAYNQQAAVELSPEGLSWLNEKLEAAFQKHGKVPADELSKLDWPDIP